jgi:hypothetical protein
MAPLIDGENVTLSVQVALAAKAPLHGVVPLPTALKSPLDAIEEMVTVLALVFCTETVFPALVVPTPWLGNANDGGVNFNGAVAPPVPMPESFISSGL